MKLGEEGKWKPFQCHLSLPSAHGKKALVLEEVVEEFHHFFWKLKIEKKKKGFRFRKQQQFNSKHVPRAGLSRDDLGTGVRVPGGPKDFCRGSQSFTGSSVTHQPAGMRVAGPLAGEPTRFCPGGAQACVP